MHPSEMSAITKHCKFFEFVLKVCDSVKYWFIINVYIINIKEPRMTTRIMLLTF